MFKMAEVEVVRFNSIEAVAGQSGGGQPGGAGGGSNED